MRDDAIQAMFAQACLGPTTEEELVVDLRAFLERHGLELADIDAICAAPPRLALYKRLVRNNLLGVTARMMPRARARLNALAGGAFDASFDEYLATASPHTHYLREVPGEFLAWATPRWLARADLPPYAADLAAFEVAEFDVAATPNPRKPRTPTELALDRPLAFCAAHRLLRCSFAVHELPEDPGDRRVPEGRDFHLLVFRDVEHGVRTLELSAAHASLLEGLLSGKPLRVAVERAATETGQTVNDDMLRGVAELLAMLGEHGVLLGGEAF